jgi:hypothetical protein
VLGQTFGLKSNFTASRLFMNDPMNPLQTSLLGTEFLIRARGTNAVQGPFSLAQLQAMLKDGEIGAEHFIAKASGVSSDMSRHIWKSLEGLSKGDAAEELAGAARAVAGAGGNFKKVQRQGTATILSGVILLVAAMIT